jgi:hypothetical protein
MIPPLPFVLGALAHSFYLTEVDLAALDSLRAQFRDANPSAAVRLIRGTRCHTEPNLFGEFAAALQFPLYFGQNWDALVDCLSDVDRWVQAEQTALIIADADHILLHDDSLSVKAFEVLHQVIVERNTPIRVLLHLNKTDPAYPYRRERFLGRLRQAKINPLELG